MALLNKLFKPKWQHKDPAVRIAAIAQLSDEQTLINIVTNDADLSVRLKALQGISSKDLLDQISTSEQKELRSQARQQRLTQLLPTQNQSELANISSTEDLVTIANLTDNDALRIQAIEKISDENTRLDIASNNPVAKVRLVAAQGIRSVEQLQILQGIAQGKDKALYRFCKDRLNDLKQAENAQQQLQENLDSLVSQAQALAKSAYSPEYNGKAQLLKKQWAAVSNDASQVQSTTFNEAISHSESILQAHADEEKAQQEQVIAIAQAKTDISAVLAEIIDLTLEEETEEKLKALNSRWSTATKIRKADKEQSKQFEQHQQSWFAIIQTQKHLIENEEALQQLIKQVATIEKRSVGDNKKTERAISDWLKKLRWDIDNERPTLLTELESSLNKVREYAASLQAGASETRKQLEKHLEKLEQAIEQGHLKDANKLHQQASGAIKKLDPASARPFQNNFKNLTARLHEFRDWQGYAAKPKKEALCAEMEALAQTDMDAERLAEKIKILQSDWKNLGPIAQSDDKMLWQRFKTAADIAYEPCRAHYAQVADLRKANLDNRYALIEQLAQYEAALDWNTADWGIVQKTLNAARTSFRDFSPVDRSAHKDSQQAFQDISDKIYQHIKDEYDRNVGLKEALIQTAKDLTNTEDTIAAMESCKRLQQDWKLIGITPMKADQRLWKDFRAACDAVFARRDEERQAHRAEIASGIESAEALVQQAESFAADPSSDAQQKMKELQQSFADSRLPKGPYQKLRKRLEDAADQQQQALQQLKLEREQSSWLALNNKLMAIADKSAENSDTLWAQETKLPKLANQLDLESAWENAGQQSANELELRKACISLEVSAGIDSPAEDQSLRMEYQVQRLAEGLGNAGTLEQQVIKSLQAWLTMPSTPAWCTRYSQALLEAAKKLA